MQPKPPAEYRPPQTATAAINSLIQETASVPVLLNQEETARILGVSPKWLERDRWVGASIPFVKVGRGVRYRASDLAAFVEANTHGAA